MKILKFGGGVLKSSGDIKRMSEILNNYKENTIIVVSAFGKTTSKLEQLVNTYNEKGFIDVKIFNEIQSYHFLISEQILNIEPAFRKKIVDYFNNLKNEFTNINDYDFFYDKVVSYGELLSSVIIFEYLKQNFEFVNFEDIRESIKTDSYHREAKINWETTKSRVNENFNNKRGIIVTQGFMASDNESNTTTLGKEGSDFTAAILAYCTDAEEVIFWKEADGICNADPKIMENAILLPELSYREVVEQVYYGAKILHPKTIKPLQNKKIKVSVKSFYNPNSSGTEIKDISEFDKNFYPNIPIYIEKDNQILISVSPLDFSFIAEENLGYLFNSLANYKIKVNLMQTSAIKFSICVDNDKRKINDFIDEIKKQFDVRYNDNLKLITFRHAKAEHLKQWEKDMEIILEQNTRITARYVIKNDYESEN